jgi:hypothetical protein
MVALRLFVTDEHLRQPQLDFGCPETIPMVASSVKHPD